MWSPQGFVALGSLLPRRPQGGARQPDRQAALDHLGGGEAPGEPPPGKAADEGGEEGLSAVVRAGWGTAVATPHDRGQPQLAELPDLRGQLAGKVGPWPCWSLLG
jgi:hypothetical protein